MSSGSPSSGCATAAALPVFSKALFTSATERSSLRTDPSPTRPCQSRISLFVGSMVFDACGATLAAALSWAPSRPLLISFVAERTILSPMTRTVTVAPLTMSTWGAGAVPLATRAISAPISLLTASRFARFSGMPTRTMGSLCSTSFSPVSTPFGIDADREKPGSACRNSLSHWRIPNSDTQNPATGRHDRRER